MSSDKNPECNEAVLQAKFEQDLPELRREIGDSNGDGRLSAAELQHEVRENPKGPLANLLRLQAMPDLRHMQTERGVLHQMATLPETVKKIDPKMLEAFVHHEEKRLTEKAQEKAAEKITAPLGNIKSKGLCELASDADAQIARSLVNVFALSDATKQATSGDLQRGAMMIKSLNSVEIGSVQVLYDHLATPEDAALVKSRIDQRVKQLTQPEQAPQQPQKPPITRC